MIDTKQYQDLMDALMKAFSSHDDAPEGKDKPKAKTISIVSISHAKPEVKGSKIPKLKKGEKGDE